MAAPHQRSKLLAAAAALVALTFALYARTARHEFVNVDVSEYLTENPHMQHGLTWEGFRWAWNAGYASNWHPLTWLSHMLDVELFGFEPGRHNLANVAWHAGNAVLVLLLFARWTRNLAAGAFVAACFALHPLHVESVAWIAERKDVLAAFFGLAALLAWTSWAERRSRAGYALALVSFALGLMAKPSIVTWPFVLLLLDVWPFRERSKLALGRRIAEVAPFLALSAASCALTWKAQSIGRAMDPMALLPVSVRFVNGICSYGRYAWDMVWPEGLAMFYPHEGTAVARATIALSALFVLALLVLAWRWRRSRPWFTFGACFYLGTLVPMIGFVQVGAQARADRYTYLPLLGLFLIVALGAAELVRARPSRRAFVALLGVLALAGQLAVAWKQVGYWKNSETLGRREIDAVGENAWAYNLIGGYLLEKQRFAEAAEAMRRATELSPRNEAGWSMLGKALALSGDKLGAERAFRSGLAVYDKNPGVMNHLAQVLLDRRTPESVAEAELLLERALALDDTYAGAHNTYGELLLLRGDVAGAEREFARAVHLFPQFLPARMNLARSLLRRGENAPALEHIEAVLRLAPGDFEALRGRARALTALGRERDALATLDRLLALRPGWPPVLGDLCWLLATARDETLRDVPRAVAAGEEGVMASRWGAPAVADALGVAYALAGRFDEAAQAARNAADRAREIGDATLAERAEARLAAYLERRVDLSIPR